MADSRHAARTLASTVGIVILLLALPLAGAQARMVKIHVGDTWRQAIQLYSKEKGLSPEATERWIRQQERLTGNRLLDDFELPEGAELDFYKVRNSKDPSKRVEFLGRGRLVDAYSWIGRHYQEFLFSLLSTDKRDEALALLRQAREHGYMIVPASINGPTATVRPAAAQTIRAIVIAPEFPHWIDPRPVSNGDTTRDAPGANDMYFLSNADTTAPRNYPGAGNAPYEPSEYNRRDYYFDSPGGRIVGGIPLGMQSNTGAWSGTNPGATSNPDGHPRAGGPLYKPQVQLQNDWFNTVFNKSNPDSLYNYFYQNSHGHISIEGDYSNVVGWVEDHHILDRWPYPNGCYYAVQPGTPLLRPTPDTALDPILGGGRTFQPIVRASLHSQGITLLLRTDAMGRAFTRGSIVNIRVYQTQDINSAVTGTQQGWVSISNATTNTTVVVDPWDNRRVTLLNNGWVFVDAGDPTKVISYQMASLYPWSIDVNLAGVGTCRWASNHIGDSTANPDQANPCYRDQNEGCGAMPDTLFTAADLYVDNTLQAAPYPTSYYYIGSAPGNRLLSFCYYTHNHNFNPNASAYQLRNLLTNGYRDDIAGNTEGTKEDRPYPFDHDMNDHNYPNAGNVLSSDPSPSHQHTAARMRADVYQTLTDQGISYGGYDLQIFLYPGSDQSEGDPNATIIPHASGNVITVPEGVSLNTLRHETCHTFGAVDLYDNDLYANAAQPPPVPRKIESNMAGPYSIMAHGVRVDPWHKIHSWMRNGPWVDVSKITRDLGLTQIWRIEQTLRDPVVLKLPAHPLAVYASKYIAEHGPGSVPPGYPGTAADFAKLADPDQWQEYFLVENRDLTGSSYFGDASPRGLYVWHIDERNIGGFQCSEETPSVIPVQADGLDELTLRTVAQGPGDLAGDPFPGSQNNRNFRERSVVLPNGARSPVSWSHGIADVGGQTILPGTPTDSFVRITNISDPGNPMTAQVYVEPAEVKVTGTSLVPPVNTSPDYQPGDVFYRVRQGVRNFPVELITLDNDGTYPNLSTRDVTIDQIKVYEVGTSLTDTNIVAARLYEDTNGNGKLDVNEDANGNGILDPYEDHNGNGILDTTDVDKLLKVAPVIGDYVTFTNLGYVVPLRSGATPPVQLIVAYDIAETATVQPAITLAAELTDYTFVSPNPPGAVQERTRTAGTNATNAGYMFGTPLFPITSSSTMVVDNPDTLTITSRDLVPTPQPAPVLQGATDVPMQQLELTVDHDSVTLSSLTVKQVENAIGGTDVSVVRLWWDKNNSGSIDASDQLLGQAAVAGGAGAGVATISGLTFQVNESAPQYLILAVNLPAGAQLGKKIQLEITDGTAFVPQTIPGQPADIISSVGSPWRSGVIQVHLQNQPPYAPPVGTGVDSGYDYTQDWFPPNAPAAGSALPVGALPQFRFPRGRDLSNDPPGGPGGRGTGVVDPDTTVDTPATVSYEVDFSQDSAFPPSATQTRVVAASASNDPIVTFTPPALASGTWYWRARTVDTTGQKSPNSSPVLQFTVITAPSTPTLLYPLAGDSPVTASTPTYRWVMGTDPDTPPAEMRTVVEVDDNADFSSIAFRAVSVPGATDSTGWTVEYYDTSKFANATQAQTLSPGITYYWRARARDKYDLESPNSAAAHFTTASNLAPGTPVGPFAPSGGTVVTTANPVLSWGRSTDPDPADTPATLTYYVELDTNDDWTDGVNLIVNPAGGQVGPGIATTPITMTVLLPNLQDNTQYYWRVRAKDQGGLYSDWSPTQTFWVNTVNNPPNQPTGLSPIGRVGPSSTSPTVVFRPTLQCAPATDPDTFPPAAAPTLTYVFRIKKGPALPWNPDTSWDFQGTPAAGVTQWTTPALPWDPVTDPIWYWAVKAVDPQGASSSWAIETIQLDREPNAPPADNPLNPADWLPNPGSVVRSATPTLQFPVTDSLNPAFVIDPDDNAVDPRANFRYTIQLASDASFTTNLRTITNVPPSDPLVPTAPVAYTLTAAEALTPGTWYWRVTTTDSFGLAAGTYNYATGTMTAQKWSPTYTFTVNLPPNPPVLTYPPDGSVISEGTPTYQWNLNDPDGPAAGGTLVTVVEVANNPGFIGATVLTSAANDVQVVQTPSLSAGITYYLRAKTRDTSDGAESAYTAVRTFTVGGNVKPNPPVSGFVPSQDSVQTTGTPTLSWNAATDPNPADVPATLHYEVQLTNAPGGDWTKPVLPANIYTTAPGVTNVPVVNTLADGQWYWRVRTYDSGGLASDWSSTRQFYVNTVNDPPAKPSSGFQPVVRIDPTGAGPVFQPVLQCAPTTDPDTFPPAPPPMLTYVFRLKFNPTLPWDPANDATYDYQYTAPAGTSAVTVAPALTWPVPGDAPFYWAVKAIDQYGAESPWSDPQSFKLDRAPVAPLLITGTPSNYSPEDGALTSQTPTLTFPAGSDPDNDGADPYFAGDTPDRWTYVVELTQDATLTTWPVRYTGITPNPVAPYGVSFTVPTGLASGIWYWRVFTVDKGGIQSAAPSTVHHFKVAQAPTPPTGPFSPSGGLMTGDLTPTFSWTLGTDADTPSSQLSTVIELADNPGFLNPLPLLTATGGAQTIDQPTDLQMGRTYYWRAKTVDSDGLESAWTAVQSFVVGTNTKPNPPQPPFAPSGSQVLTTATPTLSWLAGSDPNPEDPPSTLRYQVQLRIGNANWGDAAGLITITSGDTTAEGVTSLAVTATTPALTDNGHYYWRVRTLDRGGLYSDWGPTQDFYLNLVNNKPDAPSTGFDPASGTRLYPVQVVPTVAYRATLACGATTDPDTFPPGPPPPLTNEFRLKYNAPAGWNPNLPAYASDYDYQLTAPAGSTSVTTPTLTYDWANDKAWSWVARAVDQFGAASDWSAVQILRLDRPPLSPDLPAGDWLPTAGQAVVDTPLLQFPAGSDPDVADGDTVGTLSYVIELSQDNFATIARTYVVTAAGNGDPNAPNRLQFNVPTPLAAGSWQWRVTSVDKGNLPATAPSAIHTFVVNHAPLPPTNLAPNGVPTTTTQPTLTWTLGTDPDLDDIPSTLTTVIEVDDDPTTKPDGSFVTPAYVQSISGPTASYLIPGALSPGVTYYWHGKTVDSKGFESAWSATVSFTVANSTAPNPPVGTFTVAGQPNFPAQPIPPIPATALEINTDHPVIQWPAATDPDTPASGIHYVMELDTNDDWGDMNNLLGAANVTPAGVTQLVVPAGILADNGHYYYRVRAVDADGQMSDWSASYDFWVNLGNNPPLAPNSGFSPTNGQVTGVRPTLTCNHAVDPDPSDQLIWPTKPPRSYVFQLRSIDGNFAAGYTYQFTVNSPSAIANPVTVSLDLSTAPGAVDLTDKTNWFWRVRCIDQHGQAGAWSAAQGFYVDAKNLPPTLAPPNGSAALALVPQAGTLNPPTHFEFHVIYSDPEGDAPLTGVWVELDGNPAKRFLMQQLDPSRTSRADYQSGVEFVYGIEADDPAVGKGPHTFQFQTFGAVWPATPGTGPIVNVPSTLRLADATWASVPAPPFKGYEEGQTVYIEVTDPDQDTDPLTRQSVQVVLTVNGTTEGETVTLLETDINTGVFRGSIPMRGATGAPNDGVLNVVAGPLGATISATYTDQYSPSLDTQTVSALVLDQTAPAPAQPALSAASGPNGVTIELDWSLYDQSNQVDVSGYQIFCNTAPFNDVSALTPVVTIGPFTPGTPGAPKTYTLTAARSGATAVSLQNDTTYYVAVVPIDEVPNRDTAVTGLAVHTVDTTPPTLGSTSPGNGAQRNADIVFHVLDAGSGVNAASVHAYMSINGGPEVEISGTPQWTVTGSPADLTCAYNPPTDFQWNDSVTIRVTADDNQPAPIGPNHMEASYTFLVLLDTTGPTIPVGGISPAPGATGVAVTAPVSFRITDDLSGVDPTTIKVIRNGVDITSQCGVTPASGVPGAYDVRFPATGPGANLWNETVTITVQVKDLAGNPINPPTNSQTWSFDVAKDADGPVVSNLSPAPGTSTAAPTDPISFRVTDAVSGVDQSTLQVYVNGTLIPAANLVIAPVGGGITVTYTPAAGAYSYGQAMTVRVVVRDVAGNLVQDESPVIGAGNGFEWAFTMSTAPRYRILGTVTNGAGAPVGGVTITVYEDVPGGAVLGTALTDGNGNYTVTGLLGGTACRIVPSLSEYDFTPTELHATVGTADVRDQNFVAKQRTYSISGTVTVGGVGLAGVTVSDGLRSAVTDANGKYTITGVPAGRYTITPTLAYYAFRPSERTVTIPVPGADQTGIDFEAVPETFTISGTVRDYDGNRVQGVRITDGTHSAITNESGLYTLSDIQAGTVTLSASKAGYTFTPATQSVTVPPNATGIDFVAYQAFTTSFPVGLNFIGVPCYPETEDATAVFGTNLVARWNPSAATPGYVTPASTSGLDVLAVRPGRGFWVNLPSSDLVVGGRPVSTTRPFTMTLGPAWNMAANPFNIPLAFANITPGLPGSIRPYGYVYQATAPRGYLLISAVPGVNVARTQINPWEGIWLRCTTSSATLTITPSASTSDAAAAPKALDLGAGGYAIPICARTTGSADRTTSVGVSPALSADLELENPPMAPQTVDVYLTSEDGRYLSQQIRATTNAAQSWNFVVVSNEAGKDVEVSLPDLSQVPNNLSVYLTDLETGKRMYARTLTAYTFTPPEVGAKRQFKLEVVPRSEAGLVVSGASASVGGRGAVVTYNVSKDCQVTVRVTNIAGRVVRVLANGVAAAKGVNSTAWDLRSAAGTPVPAGRYLIQIEATSEDGQRVNAVVPAMVTR